VTEHSAKQEAVSDGNDVSQKAAAPVASGFNLPTWPAAPPATIPAATSPGIRKRTWAVLGIGAGMMLLGLSVYWMNQAPEPTLDVSDLPEWFALAHRIRQPRPYAGNVKGVGIILPPERGSPLKLTPEWFEKHFTHYMKMNSFVWASPKHEFESHGKIWGGIKVIFGKEVGPLSLVCVLTNDGRPINMFVENENLRPRSQGPPPKQDDD
jgi:hypothetical protein